MKFLRPIFLVSLCFIMLQGYSYAVFQPYFQLPSQTGNSGKVLGTNGTTPSWVTGGGGGASLSADQTFTGANTFSNSAGLTAYNFQDTNSEGVNAFSAFTTFTGGLVNIGSNSGNGELRFQNHGVADSSTFYYVGSVGDSLAGINCSFDYDGSQVTLCVEDSTGRVSFSGSVVAPLYTDSTTSATMSLGRTGAPSGVCVSGSIYTRSDGTTLLDTRYTCIASMWISG